MPPDAMATTPSTGYLQAWLSGRANRATLAVGALAVAVAAALGGPTGALVGLAALAAVQMLLALAMPGAPGFRHRVDQAARRGVIERRRAQLHEALFQVHGGEERVQGMALWRTYQAIVERAALLHGIAGDPRAMLSHADAERVDQASVDFLALWLGEVTIRDRLRSGEDATIAQRLAQAEQALSAVEPADPRHRHLAMARDEYLAVKRRHDELLARRMAIGAALVSLPDQVEAIYQITVASPDAGEAGSRLGESLARLRLQEDIALDLARNDLDSPYFRAGAASVHAAASHTAPAAP